MPRRRTFLPRPHDSLHAAAEKHAAIVASATPALEEPEPVEHEHETDTKRPTRKRQAHDAKGRFT